MLICRYVIPICLSGTGAESSFTITQQETAASTICLFSSAPSLVLTRGPSAAFPLFGIQLYEGLGFQWATGLLAFVTLAMLPFPYLFFRYGKRIRARSRFAKAT